MGSVVNVGALPADAVRACPPIVSNPAGVRTRAGCGKAGRSDQAEIGWHGAPGAIQPAQQRVRGVSAAVTRPRGSRAVSTPDAMRGRPPQGGEAARIGC